MILDVLLPTFSFLNTYLPKLVIDIPDEDLTKQPLPDITMNHAAWTLTHLLWAHDNALKYLGGTPTHADLITIAGIGTIPNPTRSAYPAKAILLSDFEAANTRLLTTLQTISPEILSAPAPERMQKMFPTLAPMIAGLLTSHYSSHIGQLSAWRRACGYKSVF